jgi:hypothetical protein
MPRIEMLSSEFIAFGQKQGRNQRAELSPLCPVFGLVAALRSLSSVALSSARVLSVYHAFYSTLCKGDISTLQNKGHFYFALT